MHGSSILKWFALLVGAALLGLPVQAVLNYVLIGGVLVLAFSTLVGAKHGAESALHWIVVAVVAGVVWAGFAHTVQTSVAAFPKPGLLGSDLGAWLIGVGVLAGLYLLAMGQLHRPAHPAHKPQARRRIPVADDLDARPPGFGSARTRGGADDDLGLFGGRDDQH